MARTKVNSGHGRHTGTKTGAPTKPAPTKVRTGFQALEGLNTTGARRGIPHTASSTPTMDYTTKLKVAGVGVTSRKAKKMF